VSIVVIAFRYGFASMTFDEVIRNSRSIPNWNWTNNFLTFPERNRKNFRNKKNLFSRKSIKCSRSGRFYRVGRKRGNKQYFNFGLRAKTGWLGIMKMYLSGETCLSVDFCFSELAQWKSS